MPKTRPLGARLLSFALGGYLLFVLAVVIAATVSGEENVSYLILGLDCVLVALGLFAARAIYSLTPKSRWLFLGWLATSLLVALAAFLDMLRLGDSLSALGALLGASLVALIGAAGFRYLSRICRPAA